MEADYCIYWFDHDPICGLAKARHGAADHDYVSARADERIHDAACENMAAQQGGK